MTADNTSGAEQTTLFGIASEATSADRSVGMTPMERVAALARGEKFCMAHDRYEPEVEIYKHAGRWKFLCKTIALEHGAERWEGWPQC